MANELNSKLSQVFTDFAKSNDIELTLLSQSKQKAAEDNFNNLNSLPIPDEVKVQGVSQFVADHAGSARASWSYEETILRDGVNAPLEETIQANLDTLFKGVEHGVFQFEGLICVNRDTEKKIKVTKVSVSDKSAKAPTGEIYIDLATGRQYTSRAQFKLTDGESPWIATPYLYQITDNLVQLPIADIANKTNKERRELAAKKKTD